MPLLPHNEDEHWMHCANFLDVRSSANNKVWTLQLERIFIVGGDWSPKKFFAASNADNFWFVGRSSKSYMRCS